MYLSHNLLCSFVSEFKNIKIADLNNACNNLGIEIERILTHPKLTNLVVGQIVSLSKVTGSNHLSLVGVQVNQNSSELKKIICGASNLQINQKVVVALNGCRLYDGRIITKKSLLGIESEGMICSYKELTPLWHDLLDRDNANGIISLDNDAPVGETNISSLLGLDDTIFELTLPTNRHDWTGAVFVIKDLSSYFGFKFNLSILSYKSIFNNINIDLLDSICNESRAIIVNNISNKNSNWKLKKKLLNSGIAVKNALIDEINFLTYLTGVTPLIFDYSLLNSTEIKQRYAKDNELIDTIDGVKRLSSNDIIYLSDGKIIALSGSVVNKNYLPTNNTKNLLLIVDILKSNTKKNSVVQINIFVNMLAKIFDISISKQNLKYKECKQVAFNIDECSAFLSIKSKRTITNILKKLNFNYADGKSLLVPSYRDDLNNQWDIFEEILKIYGINNLQSQPILTALDVDKSNNDDYFFIKNIQDILVNNYFNEVKNYNLTSFSKIKDFNIFDLEPFYKINPCSNKSHEYMRLNLINGLVETMQYNLNRKNKPMPIFEIQKIYTKRTEWNLTCLAPEKIQLDNINLSQLIFNTFGLKGIVREIANFFHADISFKKATNNYLFSNDCIAIYFENNLIGYIGCIKNYLLNKYKISQNLYVLTMNLNLLINNYKPSSFKVKPIMKIPPIIKDLTFNTTEKTDMESIILNLNKFEFIDEWEFINMYKVNENEIAYTIRIVMSNDSNKSLTKDEINVNMSTLFSMVDRFNAFVKGVKE